MDAIIGRTANGTAGATVGVAAGVTAGRSLERAAAQWLRATRKLTQLVLAEILDVLVRTSRAGLMVRNGGRRRLRLLRP